MVCNFRYYCKITLNMYHVEEFKLFKPSLEELVKVIQEDLITNFAEVDVQVVDCPDLTQKPFMLSAEGLCGTSRIADIGGPEYLLPLAQKDKIYSFKDIAKSVGVPNAFIIGAGAGDQPHVGINCVMMANLQLGEENNINTRIAKLDKDGVCELVHLKDSTDFCILGNLYISEGKPGKVIKVVVKKRTGSENFISSIRLAIGKKFEDPVGMGGIFIIRSGKAKLHLMGLNIRVEHTHCFSDHGVGGHYHGDTTPDSVEYEGYFNVADILYRIDQPAEALQFGKD